MGVCPVFTLLLERNLPDHMGSVLAIVFEYYDDLKYSDAQREQYYKHGYYYGIHYAWNEQLSRKVYRSKDDIFCRWCFHSENHREIRQGFDIKDVREDGERQRFEERRKRRKSLSPNLRAERDRKERNYELSLEREYDRGGGERFGPADFWAESVRQDRACREVKREKERKREREKERERERDRWVIPWSRERKREREKERKRERERGRGGCPSKRKMWFVSVTIVAILYARNDKLLTKLVAIFIRAVRRVAKQMSMLR
jgi:hypothetical protein